MTCFFADAECRGRLEWHHVLPKQRLKQEFRYGAILPGHTGTDERVRALPAQRTTNPAATLSLDAIVGDERNRVFLCSFHHERLTNARIHIPREALPASVEEFAKDFGLLGWLDRYLGVAA